MSPSIPVLRKKLGYPLYGADFDPLNQDFLLVGGGGGSTSSGVPNKISLIDTSRRDDLTEVVDIELAKDEDSVTTLAVSESSETALSVFAGINSSQKDQIAGKNEHLRLFRLALPPRKRKADGEPVSLPEKTAVVAQGTQALGRTALFKRASEPKNDTYQRVLRISPIKKAGQSRIVAAASGLADPENEIVAFEPVAVPGIGKEISRIPLGRREAEDVDVLAAEDDGHVLAYCTENEVFLQRLPSSKESKPQQPVRLHQSASSTGSLPPSKRQKFRALRFLTPRHILLLQNKPNQSGVDLLILRRSQNGGASEIKLQKRLSKSIKSALGFDVCPLSESQSGERQYIIAVAGQNNSIDILTIEFSPATGFRAFTPYTTLHNVHGNILTRLVFSNFIGPALPLTSEAKPQSVRLASVDVDGEVVVHTLRLRPYPATKTKSPRYVLVPPGSSETLQTTFSVFIALFVIGMAAFLMQVFCEIRGAVPPTLGATEWLSPAWKERISQPYVFADGGLYNVTGDDIHSIASSATEKVKDAASNIPTAEDVSESIQDTVQDVKHTLQHLVEQNTNLETPKAIIVRDDVSTGELSTELHHDAELIKQETLKKWEDLSEHQQRSWKRRLVDAGHWAENQGESVLKGVLFSELGGFVAQAVRG